MHIRPIVGESREVRLNPSYSNTPFYCKFKLSDENRTSIKKVMAFQSKPHYLSQIQSADHWGGYLSIFAGGGAQTFLQDMLLVTFDITETYFFKECLPFQHIPLEPLGLQLSGIPPPLSNTEDGPEYIRMKCWIQALI